VYKRQIQAWGAVALVASGFVAASAAWSARTLVDDRFVGDGPSPFAAVKEYGFGFAAIVAASVAADVVVTASPANAVWLANLCELLSGEAKRRARLRGSTADAPQRRDVPDQKVSLVEVIAAGESQTVEFKSNARWSHSNQQIEKHVEDEIVKTVAGFMNASGGQLLIGVADDGRVHGLASDYKVTGNRGRDGFENWLIEMLGRSLGVVEVVDVRIAFESIEGEDVCLVDVPRSDGSVYAKTSTQSDVFFLRRGNTTKKLSTREAVEYTKRQKPDTR